MSEEALIQEMTDRCGDLAHDRHLVVIQDTRSFNLNTHYYRLKKDSGIGPIINTELYIWFISRM